MTERFTGRATTRSARATHTLGRRLGRLLAPGDVVALVGELGAGKTQLVRGACAGAAVPEEEVSSPSFAIPLGGAAPSARMQRSVVWSGDHAHQSGFPHAGHGEPFVTLRQAPLELTAPPPGARCARPR